MPEHATDYLAPNAANHVALSPLSFLQRSVHIHPHKTAVIHGARNYSYREFYERCVRLAAALHAHGVAVGTTVSVLAPNIPALLEAHYGVAMAGGVLNAINTRLDASTIRFMLHHAECRVFLVDSEYSALAKAALEGVESPPLLVEILDNEVTPNFRSAFDADVLNYEAWLAAADPHFAWQLPVDEWQSLALNYTSGTTGDPKGVLYHHRGAYLNAMSNVIAFKLATDSVYLWTLPMFHCNGWTMTWAVTLAGGTHVCLRQVDPARIFALIGAHSVTHLCGAPIVLNMIANAPELPAAPFVPMVEVAVGGATPPSAIIERIERLGFHVTHLYGLTETYGPATLCEWQSDWDDLAVTARAQKVARQGVITPAQGELRVIDVHTGADVPGDGNSIGEIVLRGNTVMKGYLKNSQATHAAFTDGWFHTGDLAVMHADGYIEIKDRAKDIIISGGENISTLEIEEVLYRHPAVLEASVAAKPDEKWGETPCAFVTLKAGQAATAAEIMAWCREHLAHFKCPRHVVFGELPKTSTGKIQKYILRDWARALK
ncbi:MAG: AMP-binding protein [Spongiibacteraceae bacterium]